MLEHSKTLTGEAIARQGYSVICLSRGHERIWMPLSTTIQLLSGHGSSDGDKKLAAHETGGFTCDLRMN